MVVDELSNVTPVDIAGEDFLQGPEGTDFLSYIEWEVEVVIDTCKASAIEGYGRYPGGWEKNPINRPKLAELY